MQRAHLARALRWLLTGSLGIAAIACGSDAPIPVGPVAGEAVRKDYQQKKAAAAERVGSHKGSVKAGTKPGP